MPSNLTGDSSATVLLTLKKSEMEFPKAAEDS